MQSANHWKKIEKIQYFSSSKMPLIESHTVGEDICNIVSNKELRYRIYKEFLQINRNKDTQPN